MDDKKKPAVGNGPAGVVVETLPPPEEQPLLSITQNPPRPGMAVIITWSRGRGLVNVWPQHYRIKSIRDDGKIILKPIKQGK